MPTCKYTYVIVNPQIVGVDAIVYSSPFRWQMEEEWDNMTDTAHLEQYRYYNLSDRPPTRLKSSSVGDGE